MDLMQHLKKIKLNLEQTIFKFDPINNHEYLNSRITRKEISLKKSGE